MTRTPPTVSVAGPATTPVTETITLTVLPLSDNVGGVVFIPAGRVVLGTEDVSSPYSISWNTATTSNGAHQIPPEPAMQPAYDHGHRCDLIVQNTSLIAAYGF